MSEIYSCTATDTTNYHSLITSLSSFILENLNGTRYLYFTKLLGLIYLCEYHCEIYQINGHYQKTISGPVDAYIYNIIHSNIKAIGWSIDYSKNGEHPDFRLQRANFYGPLKKKILLEEEHKIQGIKQLTFLLKPMDWEQMKLITTLYASWNDLIITRQSFTDSDILWNARYKWPNGVRKIPKKYWFSVLAWLRSKDLTPHGYGNLVLQNSISDNHRQVG